MMRYSGLPRRWPLLRVTACFCLMMALTWAAAAGAATGSAVIRMGFYLPTIRDANLSDLKVSLQVWADEIGRPFGYRVITATYENLTSVQEAMKRGELDFINAGGMELAELFGPGDLLGGYARHQQGVVNGLALVVSKASGIQSFDGLRGKRLSRLEHDRLSDVFLEVQCLKAGQLPCHEFLTLSDTRRDIQSVHNVFFGRADAALVTLAALQTATELNPQVGQRLQVILDWKTRALIFGMMTRHADPAMRDLFVGSGTEALKTARGRQMLELFKTDHTEVVDANVLAPYRNMLRDYRELSKTRPPARTK